MNQIIIKQLFTKLVLASAIVAIGLAANFAFATWGDPTADAPNGNTQPPVNTSAAPQTKPGMLTTQISASADHMRSDVYCNYDGTVCASIQDLINGTGSDVAMPACTADTVPIAVDVVESTRATYLFAYPGRVDVHLIGGGGGGGAVSVDSGRESVAAGGGGGGFAKFTIPNAQDIGAANITVGTGGAGGDVEAGSGNRDSGSNGRYTRFTLGSYRVTANGGRGGGTGHWGSVSGARGGTVSFNTAANALPNRSSRNGGGSADCSKGSNAHGATGGGSPNLELGARYNRSSASNCSASGAEAVTGSGDSARLGHSRYYSLVNAGGGNGDSCGKSCSGSDATGGNGERGSGGGGAATQRKPADGGNGGAGLAVVYYFNCRM